MAWVGVEKLLERLLGVKGLGVRGARFETCGLVEVEVRAPRRKFRCGVCGRPCPRYDSCPPRLWRHLALGRTAFRLSYAPHRVECREHGVRVEQVLLAAYDAAHVLNRHAADGPEKVSKDSTAPPSSTPGVSLVQ